MSRSRSPARQDVEMKGGDKEITRVYVGNLSYQVRDDDLLDYFSKIGRVVRAKVLMQENGRRSMGCGIVEYEESRDAAQAMKEMNEVEWMGRKMFIREDREEDSFKPKRENNSRSDSGRQLFVGNLPFSVSWQDLKDLFKRYGHVARADVIKNYDGRSKGCGVVVFENIDDARYAIDKLDGTDYEGRRIEVREDRFADSGRGGGGGGGYRDRYDGGDRRDRYRDDRRDVGRDDYKRRDRYDDRPSYNNRDDRVDRHRDRSRSRSPRRDFDRRDDRERVTRDEDEEINLYD